MPQSNAKSPQKETQKMKEDKQPVLEKPVEQPKNGLNEQKTITDAKQETKPILTKAQKKKQVKEYQKQFIQQQKAKEDIKASKPQEKVNLPPAIYPEIRNLQNQINQEGPQVPNQVNETVHQRRQPPSNTNTTEQPPVQAEGNNEQRETRVGQFHVQRPIWTTSDHDVVIVRGNLKFSIMKVVSSHFLHFQLIPKCGVGGRQQIIINN
ncbi:Hypothetical_protein [Hexamita inflata]|uniref:Hypothetical_protein n=1 Tax=Hexamita inflata TaxID=28002 RepID=A0ABP1IKD5_9EUKA